MSGPRKSVIPASACEDGRMRRSHFCVLGYVGRYTNRAGWAYIYQEEAAKTLNFSRETVNRAIRDLKKWGYIDKDHIVRHGKKIAYIRVIIEGETPEKADFTCDAQITCDAVGHRTCDTGDHRTINNSASCDALDHTSCDTGDHRTCDAQITCDAVGHTTCDIGDHTERLVERLKEEEEDRLQLRTGNEANGETGATPSPSSFQIFEEFAEAAERHGFLTPPENQFKKYSQALHETVEKIGIDRWRAFLTLAGADDLCTGRIAPGPGWQQPWRLSIRQASDAGWITERLAVWQGHRQAEARAQKIIMKPDHEDWFAVKNFYEATGQNRRASLMRKIGSWVVQPEVLAAAREKTEKKESANA